MRREQKQKAQPLGLSLFLFLLYKFSIQVEIERPPKLFEGIRVEVVWNEGQHFGTVRGKLRKFSTFRETR